MPRFIAEGAIYHVYCRGNNKVKVFHVGHDYRKYITNLLKYKQMYKFMLYAYSLMQNHLHLLIEPTREGNLSQIMRSLNVSYSIWHNRRYDCVGHVWQGRFQSRIIKDEADFINCMAYIETNPVRAGLAKDPELYKWCSCCERFNSAKTSIIELHPGYIALGETKEERRCVYHEIMFKNGPQA
ncbi:MAG: transposase [Candidatus Omnitrophica bacterium]|nr:transposase [Candidatus Omnitrophota bacterium]